jgi:hypothetical protein
MNNVEKHLKLLGMTVKDKASDFHGIVVTIGFDLYGCIQADVRPKELDKEGKVQHGYWFDINRLIITNKNPVMQPPEYKYGDIAEGKQGCSLKSPRV